MTETIKQTEVRNSTIIAAEINLIKEQTRRQLIAASIEIGKLLCEAKELVSHGDWGNWLENNVEYSQGTAGNLMRIYHEYGNEQIGIDQKSKSQAFENLTYSQAVALFSLPHEEREEFIESHDMEEMSVRDIQAEIKARKEAEQNLADEQARRESVEQTMSETQAAAEKLKAEKDKIQEQLKKMKEKAKSDKEKAEKAISDEVKEKIREEVKNEYQSRIDQLSLDKEAAEQTNRDISDAFNKKIQALEAEKAKIAKQAEIAQNQNFQKLSILIESIQEQFNKAQGILLKIETSDKDGAEKLKGGLKNLLSILIEQLK